MRILETFVRESNTIEGIHRDPYDREVEAFSDFLTLMDVTIPDLSRLQAVLAPNKPLRDRPGLDVRVGSYIAPPGGPDIVLRLETLLVEMLSSTNPWRVHCDYEGLHPYCDGNGRTGRMLWAWHMRHLGRDPFALSFLHRFYYQTLENDPHR